MSDIALNYSVIACISTIRRQLRLNGLWTNYCFVDYSCSMVTDVPGVRSETARQDCGYYSAAQAAKILGVTKRTLLKWEQQKLVPRPQRVKRGQLEYRAYAPKDLDQIRMFIHLSRVPNPNVQIIGTDADGVPIYGQKFRGLSGANMRAARDPKLPHLPDRKIHTSLNEALGAACAAALEMNATRITLQDAKGREFTIEVRTGSEEARREFHDGPETPTNQQK